MSGDHGGVPVRVARIPVVVAAWLLLAAAPARAIFDDLEFSPRARALGGSYAALSDDASALFYNPAGLVEITGHDLQGATFQPWNLGFVRANALSYAVPAGSWGTFAVGYADFRAENDGTVLSIERTVAIGQGFQVMEDLSSSLSFGYVANLYNLDYPTRSVTGVDLGSQTTFGLDVGFLARLHSRTTAGVFIKNVNNPSMGDYETTDLRQRVSGGIAYTPYAGVITTIELEKEVGEDVQIHGGLEAQVTDPLYLRFGAQSKPNLFDVGVGLVWRQVRVDLTYTHHPILDGTFRYGLRLSL